MASVSKLYAKMKKWELESVPFTTGYCMSDRNPIGCNC